MRANRDAIAEMRTGEVDAIRGYAVTRLHTGDDYARIDYAIIELIERLEAAERKSSPARRVRCSDGLGRW